MSVSLARRSGLVLGGMVLMFGVSRGRVEAQAGVSATQTTPVQSGAATTDGAASAPATQAGAKAGAKRRRTKAKAQMQTIPIEQAPASAAGPDETRAQRAADQNLLQQQQAQSAQAAQVTDQQVKTAQQRIDKVQGEQRIQDAPGPSQTGIVPAAGPPVLPASDGDSTSGGAPIQDAPGPSQTGNPATQTGTPATNTPTTTPPPQI